MRATIFFHDNCFDGATSAALFAEFYRRRHQGAQVRYHGMSHTIGDPFAGIALDGDDNACVDFRYCADPRMTWWFDHHVSGFQPESLRSHFDAHQSRQKVFDPDARSCAILLRDSMATTFDFAFEDAGEHWTDLIDWADKIDSARFRDAREAVELKAPALEITTWLAHNHDDARKSQLIELLGKRSLVSIAAEPWIAGPLAPILRCQESTIELIESRATVDGGVVFYDLTDDGITAHNKFIAYMLFPESHYTISLTCSKTSAKVSVGKNPWAPTVTTRDHNIAAICGRYGGGGHPVVGAVSLAASDLDRAREIARDIRAELVG